MDELKLSFGSDLGLTEEEYQSFAESNSGSKFFEPGTYSLKIKEMELSKDKDGNFMSKQDPTWAKFKFVFEDASGRTMNHWVLAPTKKLTYNEGVSKKPEFMYHLFREFLAGLGIENDASKESLKKVMTSYFLKPKAFIGKTVDCDIGYKGPHIKYMEKGQYKIVKKDGTPVIDDTFETWDKALAASVDLNLKIEGFTSILKFHGKKQQEPEVVYDADAPVVAEEGW